MGLGGFFKNLFGSAKENMGSLADKAEDLAENAIEKAKEAAAPLMDKAEEYVDAAKEKVAEYVPAASEAIENAVDTVKEKAGEYAHKAEEMAGNAIETVKDKVSSFTEDANAEAETKVAAETNRIHRSAIRGCRPCPVRNRLRADAPAAASAALYQTHPASPATPRKISAPLRMSRCL